jgi:UDP-glucose 4-epimerase
MQVLVTGGAGYIGSHTVKKLAERGFEPITYDNLSQGHRSAVVAGEFVFGDLGDYRVLQETFAKYKPEAVIHFAAESIVAESMLNPARYFKENVGNGMNLLHLMLENNVKILIFSSTAAVYGEPQKIPICETHRTAPINPYGESKLIFERMLRYYDDAYGLKYVSLRYFNAAGASKDATIGEDHSPETHLIPIVLQCALGLRKVVEVYGVDYDTKDGTCIRDYIHVDDLADAHILALEFLMMEKKSKIYNLGNEEGYSVKEVIDMAKKVTGVEIKTLVSERRVGDPSILIASSERIKGELGWEPTYESLEEIIESAWNWHRKNPNGFGDGRDD